MLVESPKSSQAMPPALQFLVLTFAGWVNRHQDDLSRIFARRIGSSGSTWALGRFAGPMPNAVDAPCAASNSDGAS